MAKKVGWSLNIETGIEVKQESFNKAAKIFDNFYNKYNDQQIQIDTSDMINTVKNSIAVIKNLYKDGTQDSTSWLNIRPEMKQTFESILFDAENMFSGIKTLFNDGSYVAGLENILKGFDNQLSIVFADIGAKYDELYAKQKQLAGTLGDVGDFEDDFSKSDIRARIDLLHELIQVQNEMEGMNPSLKPKDFAAGYNTKQLQNITASWKDVLSDMEAYNLQTVQQLNKRRDILNSVYKDQYDYYDFEGDKESKNYDTAIARLTEYVQDRKELIDRLQASEYELFSVDGIEEYISYLNQTISIYENYLDEFKQLKGDDNIGGNFSDVVQQLKEIKETILGLKDAFEPLTNAFADGGSAIHKILTTSVDDLNVLEAKCSEVYQMIDTISNKQFNMTNVIANGSSTQADVEQIRQFRKEARELFKEVESLYDESFTTGDKIKRTPGGFEEILNFQNLTSDLDFADISKRIKSRSAVSLGVVVDELNEWKKVLLQFNSLRNNVEAGSFNVSKYSDTSSKVKIGSKTTDQDDTITSDNTAVDSDNIENKIKKLGEEIASDLINVRTKLEETFDLSTISFNDEAVKSKIDAIYQQFVELQSKINALDLNINIPAIVAQVDDNKVKQTISDNATAESANKVDVEAQAMQDVATNASDAATAKEKFSEANKKVAKTAEETSQEVEKEAAKMEEAAGAIVEASQAADKVKVKLDADAIPQSKTVTSSETREKSIRTTSTDYTYDDGFWVEGSTTIIDDFKKRAAELKKEADKIALAQKTVDKFLSQFESKTAGQGSTITGFDALKNFKIENLDDIEKATQAMLDLDNEYNKITKNFRQGTKSMNPFVNAITGIGEMENKIKEAEIAFGALNNKPDELSNEVMALSPLLEKMKSFIAEDANGDKVITDIYGLSKAYGELNVALRQVNSNINIQKKIDTSQYKDASFGLDLEKQLSAITKQQAQWAKSGQLTDELRQKIEGMFDSLAEVTNSSELSNWKKQWSILKDEVAETKYQMDAAKKAQAQNNYGKTIYNRESRYHDTIGANLRSAGEGNLSEDFLNKINKYEEAYQRLKSLREEIANNPIANDSALMQSGFQDATLEVEKLRKEILATFKEGQKFETLNILGQQNFDTDQLRDLKSTMIEFAAEVTNGQFKFEGFNAAGTEMYGTLDKGAGSVEKVTVALREGTNTLYAYQSGTKQVSNSWQTLGNDLVNGAKRLVSMYFGFHEAIQTVRQGLTYVKEIDLALTELKKVTDETDETYQKFLGTASEVSSVIGSTVSDFTDATAAFARLGYSLNESSKMAETAIVYKNVADGLDSVEESTDSIISTMMAYGIEANNTMGIIDRFNAVGKIYCPVM